MKVQINKIIPPPKITGVTIDLTVEEALLLRHIVGQADSNRIGTATGANKADLYRTSAMLWQELEGVTK